MENSTAPKATRQVVFVTHKEGEKLFPYIVWVHELKEALETGRLYGKELYVIYYNGGTAAYDFSINGALGKEDLEVFRWPCPGVHHDEQANQP
jgi:hypothetical protein